MTVTRQLPIGHLRFPDRCVRCSGLSNVSTSIEIFQGLDLISVHSGTKLSLPLPVCTACRNRRWMLEVARFALILPICFVTLIPAIALSELWFGDEGPGLIAHLAVCLVGLFLWRRYSERIFDQRNLGVAAVKWNRPADLVALRFSDPQLANEVEQLTAASRENMLQAAREVLEARAVN